MLTTQLPGLGVLMWYVYDVAIIDVLTSAPVAPSCMHIELLGPAKYIATTTHAK